MANAETGARFGVSLAWVVLVGIVGIVVYAEMSGRVATISQRPVFDVVRERLGARIALVDLIASYFINLLTVAAEIGGLALVIELATGLNYLLWVPLVAIAGWIVIWKVSFSIMEKVFGVAGLALIIIAIAVWRLHPSWGRPAPRGRAPRPPTDRELADVLLLRDRAARRGDDAVRGHLLLVGRRRGGLDAFGPDGEPRTSAWGSRSAARSPSRS